MISKKFVEGCVQEEDGTLLLKSLLFSDRDRHVKRKYI